MDRDYGAGAAGHVDGPVDPRGREVLIANCARPAPFLVTLHEKISVVGTCNAAQGTVVRTDVIEMAVDVTEVYYRYPDYRKELFMSSFIRMLINLKNRKIPCIEDLKAIGKIFVLVSPVEFYLYYRNIKKLMSSNIKILR